MFNILPCFVIASSTIIDIQLDHNGIAFIPNGIVPGIYRDVLNDTRFKLLLSIEPSSRVLIGRYRVDMSVHNGDIFSGYNVPLTTVGRPATLSWEYTDEDDDLDPVSVGIGPGSSLLETYGSISVLKTNLQLVLGDFDGALFNSSCVEDSHARLPYTNATGLYTVDIQYQSGIADVRGLVSGIGEEMTIPATIALNIIRAILLTGATRIVSEHTSFSRCDRDTLLGILPNIVFRFNQTATSIVVYPEDYLLFDNVEHECIFKFTIESEYDHFMSFNPLVIPNVNIHIMGGEIRFCESI